MASGTEMAKPSILDGRYHLKRVLNRAIAELTAKHIDPGQGDKILVDYGCGNQPYRKVFNQFGVKYVGVDFPGSTCADHYIDDEGKTGLSDNFADIVLSTQVIEHADRPSDYLRECRRILKPGGLLFLSTHGYWKYHPHPNDYWRWTGEGLKKTIRESDFEIVDFAGVLGLGAAGLQLLQDSLIHRLPRYMGAVFTPFFQAAVMMADAFDPETSKLKDAAIYLAVGKNLKTGPVK